VSGTTRFPYHHDYDAAALAAVKGHTRVSVCIPAKDEAATIGRIVGVLRDELVEGCGLVDEIVVMDDGSSDDTAAIAAAAGATVASTAALLPELGPGTGKGEALWKSLHASSGDLVVWCDADIVDFGPRFVVGLLGPLLTQPSVGFVKGFYERPVDGIVSTGGRTTELVARPVVSLLFPWLSGIIQPLSGEYAGRRSLLEQVPFVQGYGVDLGLLVDLSVRFGLDCITQVDLGTRIHRNRTLDQLSPQALAIMQMAFRRAGIEVPTVDEAVLIRPSVVPTAVRHVERPPMRSVPAYRARYHA
jgi:glucosyl-3-phosphoglycerate synthase